MPRLPFRHNRNDVSGPDLFDGTIPSLDSTNTVFVLRSSRKATLDITSLDITSLDITSPIGRSRKVTTIKCLWRRNACGIALLKRGRFSFLSRSINAGRLPMNYYDFVYA
jgi:hypothetical protein